jgi:AcrR family transcriptional regulator
MAPPNNTLNGIVEAAAECFQKFSIKKTTIEDICERARISRPTFYRFFPNKRELILHIASSETAKINEAVTRFRDKYDDIEDVFVEALCYAINEARKNDIVDFLLNPENLEYTLEIVHRQGSTIMQYHSWEALFAAARAQNRLRPELDDKDAIRWLAMLRTMMLVYARPLNMSKPELKRLVKAYVVPAILKPPAN